ncbi:MAG TPA: sugar phosphate isomerase/epimerase [Gaiellaceae bacterium]|nr:sugar phosphate isomerase/epimerase [Gaiellaceae bacterium]
MARVGLMLYSVRDECELDLARTLRTVAAIGYEGVELFDLHGHEPGAVRGWLDELGLVAVSRHAPLDAIDAELPELAEEARALGWRRLAISWLDPTTLELPGLTGRIAELAHAARAHGLELGFHNHDAELRPLSSGRTFLDELPTELFLELDLGWAWYAGADVLALLARARGRCPLVHVKDFASRDGREFRPVGDGAVGYERLAPAALAAGVEWLLVEQDEAEGSTLEAAARSFDALTGMLAVAA